MSAKYEQVVAKLKEASALVPDSAPSGVQDTIWRLYRFLGDLDQYGESKAKEADLGLWMLVFGEDDE